MFKRLRIFVTPLNPEPIIGSYEKKIQIFLKTTLYEAYYGVYRTNELQKSIHNENFPLCELISFFNLLKYGDIHVIDEVLMHRYNNGFGKKGPIEVTKLYDHNLFTFFSPYLPLTFWCMKNLGLKIFIKNLDYFIVFNFKGGVTILIDLTRRFTHMIFRSKN